MVWKRESLEWTDKIVKEIPNKIVRLELDIKEWMDLQHWKRKKKAILYKEKNHKKIPEFQGPKPIYTFKWNISGIQSIENNITNSFVFPSQLCQIFTLCHICFRSFPYFFFCGDGGNNTDLAKVFCILYHYPSLAEVTTILKLEFIITRNIFKCSSHMEIRSIISYV